MLVAAVLMGAACWASNIWPGRENLWRGAVSRLLWWAVPFFLIALICDVPLSHAAILGGAAWVGAWIPHTEMPDIRTHSAAMLVDLVLVLVRVATLLACPAAVFWLCGAFWFGMVMAVALVLPCILAANTSLAPAGWPGLATSRQVAGVLFGMTTGACVAMCILVPDPMMDRLV